MVQGANTVVRPRFGWGWAAHTAIEKAGAELLAPGSFKGYLQKHMEDLNQQSIDQDRFHSGPNHFINLETMAKAEAGASQPPFPTVDQFFSTANAAKKAAEFKKNPLDPGDFQHFANVHKQIGVVYQQLVAQLTKLQTWRPVTDMRRKEMNASLTATMGALSHFVGDLHQPMHTTHYYSWPLAFPGRGGAHAYLESSLFQSRDFPNWQDRLMKKEQGKPAETLTLPQIQARMLRQIEAGYLKVYDLVAADRAARSQPTAAEYFSELRRNWKDISSERMEESARDLADILNSAYVEAGKPNMGVLEPPPSLGKRVKDIIG